MDADAWPLEAIAHRAEARVAAALPSTVATPRLLGTFDDGHWVILAFEAIDGAEPTQPWNLADLDRIVAAVDHLSQTMTPSPIALPREHPRLGGWTSLANARSCLTRLSAHSAWATENIARLVQLEEAGLAAAQGQSLVHFDLYPHNILLTPARVLFIDWPHARLGAPVIDLIIVLSSAAATGIDPEPILANQQTSAELAPSTIDAVLAAHAGFCLSGALHPSPPGLAPIAQYKLSIGRATVNWLQRRLTDRT